jgi:hypothetical protein
MSTGLLFGKSDAEKVVVLSVFRFDEAEGMAVHGGFLRGGDGCCQGVGFAFAYD